MTEPSVDVDPRERTKLSIGLLDRLAYAVMQRREHHPNSKMVALANEEFVKHFQMLGEIINDIEIRFTRDMFLVNQYLAHIHGIHGHEQLDQLCKEFRAINLGSIILSTHLGPEGLVFLIDLLADVPNIEGPDVINTMVEKVAGEFPATMDVIAGSAFEEVVAENFEVGPETRDDVVLRLYCHMLALARYVYGAPLPPGEDLERQIRQATTRLAALTESHLHAIIACCFLWLPTDYLPTHAVNRCFLAAALGHRAGLDDRSLRLLADAALHADIGMVHLPDEWREQNQELGEREILALQRHPQMGAWEAVRRGGPDTSIRARAVVALEHHMGADGGGYPESDLKPHLFARIAAIGDVFDAACSERGDREALTPAAALGMLQRDFGGLLDQTLVDAFVAMIGPYPPGTPVQLDTGEIAVVLRSSPDPEQPDRPRVLVVGDPEEWYLSANEVDLLTDADGGLVVGMPYPDEIPYSAVAVFFRPEELYET